MIKFSRGLSLIEVLVTIAITSIGLMGLVSLQLQAVRATTDSGNRSQAIWVFNDIVNRIHANEASSRSYVTNGIFQCDAMPATVCSTYHTGDALVPSNAACAGPVLAAWDLYEVACGTPTVPFANGAPTFSNSIGYLIEPELTISCNENPCIDGVSALTVTLQWREKADKESVTGGARTANSGLLTLTDDNIIP